MVHLLESTADGCRWLGGQWCELTAILDDGLHWGTADERKAIRLLGKTPDVEDNSAVRELRLAYCVMTRQAPQHLGELSEEKLGRPVPSKEEGTAMLRALCIRSIERLQNLATLRKEQSTPSDESEEALRHSFDDGKEAKELRRGQSTAQREMLKALEMLMKMKKQPAISESEEPSSGLAATSSRRACSARHGERTACTARPTIDRGQPTIPSQKKHRRPIPSNPLGDRGLTPPARRLKTPSDLVRRQRHTDQVRSVPPDQLISGEKVRTNLARCNPARPPMSGLGKSCKMSGKLRRDVEVSRPPPPKS